MHCACHASKCTGGQVKNFFVCNTGPRRSGKILSLWEVVRSLERRFPGQSEYIRADLMVMMVLNGNDYLPKVRCIDVLSCGYGYTSHAGCNTSRWVVWGLCVVIDL